MVRMVNSAQLKDAISKAGDNLVVVDFYAEWCGPCKILAPVLKALSEEKPDVTFVKVDVDAEAELAQEYGIAAMPTIIFLKNGQEVGKVVGANVPEIKSKIDEYSGVAVA